MWQGTELKGLARGAVARLGTDHLDLYLLHWPDEITDLSGVVAAFENLRSKGRNVEYTSNCVPHQLSAGGTRLRAEVLISDAADKKPDAAAAH